MHNAYEGVDWAEVRRKEQVKEAVREVNAERNPPFNLARYTEQQRQNEQSSARHRRAVEGRR